MIYKPIDRALEWLDDAYARSLDWVVRHRRITFFSMMSVFVVSLGLLTRVPTEFFPPSDNGRISAMVELEQNVGVDYTARIARQIDSIIYAKYPEIVLVSASAGANSSDNAFAAMQTTGSHIINYNVRLTGVEERDRSIYVISDLLRGDLDRIPEIRQYTVTPGGQSGSMSGSATVNVKVFGYDMDVTNAVANDLKEKMRRLEGVRDVKLSRDDLRPSTTWSSTATGCRTTASAAPRRRRPCATASTASWPRNTARTATSTTSSCVMPSRSATHRGCREHHALQRAGPPREAQGGGNRRGGVRRADDRAREPPARHFGPVDPRGRRRAGRRGGRGRKAPRDYPAPDGVDLEVGGTVEDQGDAFGDLGTLLILIVILVYIVMATQFESLKFPFIIMFTIPFAFTGVFLALWMTSTPLSLIALIGAIMLVGIVTKNGIVMVDYMNLLIERGSGVFDAVIAGGKSRLRPVLMTSFTTILGMLPLAIGTGAGSETWQPMGIAVIGGLTFSTILTLFIVPVLYSILVNRSQRKEREKLARLSAEHQASKH